MGLPPVRAMVLVTTSLAATLLVLFVLRMALEDLPAEDEMLLTDGVTIGGDFVAFYTGGRLFDANRDRLYDLDFQQEYRDEALLPTDAVAIGPLPFVYPPLMGALMAPISRLGFQDALFVWMGLGFVASVASLVFLMQVSGASRVLPMPILVLFCLGFPPFLGDVFLGGQAAWMGVVVLSLTSAALLRGRDFLAGIVLSLSYYKPPLFLLLLLVLCLARGRRFVVGFVVGAVVLLALSAAVVGLNGMQSYLLTVSRYTYGQEFQEGSSLDPRWAMGLVGLGVSLLSSTWATLAILAVPFAYFVWLGARLLSTGNQSTTTFGLIVTTTATVGFSLQTLHYDLALLLVPLVLAIAWFGTYESGFPLAYALLPTLFYLEYLFRKEELAGATVNGASFAFILLLGWLGWYARRLVPSAAGDRLGKQTHLGP